MVVLAPSSRSKDLLAGRRALQEGRLDGVVALARAVPVSPRSAVGIHVGVRANVATALRRGDFDVVHGFDPGVPGLSYVALLEAETTTVATFVDPERLSFPPRRNQRDRLLARIDTLLASSEEAAARARERFPGEFAIVPMGVDLDLFAPAAKLSRVVVESSAGSLPVVRAVLRSLRAIEGWEAIVLRTGRLAARPSIPLALRDRVHVRTALSGEARAEVLRATRDRRAVARRAPPPARGGSRGRVRGRRATGARGPAGARGRGGSPSDRGCADARARRRRAPGDDRGRGFRCRRGARRAPLRGGTATPPSGPPPRDRALRRPRLDRRGPPHAHQPLPRLLDRARGARRARGGGRARRDRGDRPQRLRRGAGGRSRRRVGTTSS